MPINIVKVRKGISGTMQLDNVQTENCALLNSVIGYSCVPWLVTETSM